MRLRLLAICGVAAMALTSSPVMADETEPVECYDAMVYGGVVKQIPAKISTRADEIVMSWPWFLDIDVKKVRKGEARIGVISVLALQHAPFVQNRDFNWWLRRNSEGGFNLIRTGKKVSLEPCAADAVPVQPYIWSEELSQDEIRAEAEAQMKDSGN